MRTPSHQTRGVAIVIILAFIVLLTIIVVAFFSRALLVRQSADASVSQGRADLLAKNAAEIVVSQLQQEIIAGSSTDAGYESNGIWTYMPAAPAAVVPARIGTTDDMPNLVRRSVRSASAGAPYDPSVYDSAKLPKNFASALSTTADARNRPGIALERWNKPMLLGSTLPADFTAPDWVIVTREGPQAFSAWDPALKDKSLGNPTYALGRYAYTIYDEGGLLDINAAGHPSALDPRDKARKGPLPLADLSVLKDANGDLLIPNVEALVAWRNAATSPTATPSFLDWALDPKINEGFLRVTNGDQTFLSRQDLLAYQQGVGSTVLKPEALQYLTTFSREKNAPSWSPATPTGSTVDYAADADKPASINRNLANVRVRTAFTRRNGEDAKPGEPLLTRFPLGKLSLVGYQAIGDAEIYNYFGLTRTDNTAPWVYNHGQPDKILTLDEVATRGREPDFFELLKAAILSGSVGQSAADTAGQTQTVDRDVDIHILRIGANIIDQADEDSYPTRIMLDGNVDTMGVEDLPYIYRIQDVAYRPHSDGERGGTKIGVWKSFEIWNPHQQPNGGTTSDANRPRDFRVVAKEGSVEAKAVTLKLYTKPPYNKGWDRFHSGNQEASITAGSPQYGSQSARFMPNNSYGEPYVTPEDVWAERTFDPEEDFIAFKTSDDWNYRYNPRLLNNDNYNTRPVLTGLNGSIQARFIKDRNKLLDKIVKGKHTFHTHFVGINCIGTNDGFVVDKPDGRLTEIRSHPIYTFIKIQPTSKLVFELQYLKPGGVVTEADDYIAYQSIPIKANATVEIFDDAGNGSDRAYDSFSSYGSLTSNDRAAGMPRKGLFNIDPRTTRFGMLESYGNMESGPAGLATLSSTGDLFWTYNNLVIQGAKDPKGADKPTGDPTRPTLGVGAVDFVPKSDGLTTWTNNSGKAAPKAVNGEPKIAYPAALAENAVLSDGKFYYTDPDGIVRAGDALRTTPNISANDAGPEKGTPQGRTEDQTKWEPYPNYNPSPVILNRPFRSVGELGYVFRDLPWKTIDFSTDTSADMGLLDVFSISEEPVVAGKVNMNTRQAPVLQAMLKSALKRENTDAQNIADINAISAGGGPEAAALSEKIVADRIDEDAGPSLSTSDFVQNFLNSSSIDEANGASLNNKNKLRRETLVRALAQSTSTRTWNLMIDVIAQGGRFTPSSSSLSSGFIVEGERRYWVHLALDRYTGEIIDQQWELVK